MVASALATDPQLIFSIGDQERTDVIPAKDAGMKTILIGKSEESVADIVVPDLISAITVLRKKGVL